MRIQIYNNNWVLKIVNKRNNLKRNKEWILIIIPSLCKFLDWLFKVARKNKNKNNKINKKFNNLKLFNNSNLIKKIILTRNFLLFNLIILYN